MSKWYPAEATIEIAGKMVNLKSPSKVQLRGGLNHLCHKRLTDFMSAATEVRAIDYIVDVGANMGATALMFHMAFPNARILALEPVTMNWDCLTHNTKTIPEITCRKIAAGRYRGHVDLALPDGEQRPDIDSDLAGNSGLFSIYGKGTKKETAKIDTLDNIVTSRVDFLKIDVEGAEGEVLDGAHRIMTEDRPLVIIELRKSNVGMAGHTHETYYNYFKGIKYNMAGRYLGDHIFIPRELEHIAWNRAIDASGYSG